MRKILLRVLLFCAPLGLLAQEKDKTADSAWFVTNYKKEDVYIQMRDGVRLFTTIYAPRGSTGSHHDNGSTKAHHRHPILLTRTPYSCNPYGEEYSKIWTTPKMAYARNGYIFVIQDVRGQFMSEGDYMDVRPFNPNKKGNDIDEASDSYDAIDWLVKNVKNNNGRVGVVGVSYPGFYATMAALSGHPALRAVSPQAPVTEWFIGDDFHHNGAFMLMDAFGFYSGFGKPRHGLIKRKTGGYQFPVKDNYKFYLDGGSLSNFAKMMGDSIDFWKDIYAHPNYDQFWKVRNTRNWVQHIPANLPTLVVGGLFDAEDCYGAWNLYQAIEKKADNNNKLVMGPWSHGGWAGRSTGEFLGNVRFGAKNSEYYQNNIERPFFDRYLLGKKDAKYVNEANVFFTGANKWRMLPQWPPADKTDRSLYLHGNGSLSWSKPYIDDEVKYVKYTSDPAKPVPYAEGVHMGRTAEYMDDDQRFAGRRPDVVVFKSEVLTKDMTLAGPVIADLFASISTTDADFIVKLIDVFPDNFSYTEKDGKGDGKDYPMGGYEMLVRGEVMRGRYRNSFEKPEAFEPFKITEVRYKLPDVAHVFKKGHRIMIQIQSTWFPLVDRNPQQFVDIYHCSNVDFIPCDIKIYSSHDHPSRIILPVVR
ncbi:MAG: glutaryl-7-ACA acylase [Flavipsychrobacter sp.]|jgi:putative CocE/NonD family hydrolase|nr:glutaryl-7-ACA acylase [Flavipsychrobacter sp.]